MLLGGLEARGAAQAYHPPACASASTLQSFMPHVVIKPEADGTCNMVHMTDGLAFKQLPAKPRGNAQAVLLPAAVSGYVKAAYLGVVHTEVERKYENYFYLMEVRALPMEARGVSVGLKQGQHTAAFAACALACLVPMIKQCEV